MCLWRFRGVRAGYETLIAIPGNVCPDCCGNHMGKLYATACKDTGSGLRVACRSCCKRRLLHDFGPEKGIVYGAFGCSCSCAVFTPSPRGKTRDLPRAWIFQVELPDCSLLTIAQVRGDARGRIHVRDIKQIIQKTVGRLTRKTIGLAFKPSSSLAAAALTARPILLQDDAWLSSCDLFTRTDCILQVHVLQSEREYERELQHALAFHAAGLLQQEVEFGRAADGEAEADIEMEANAAAEHEAEVELVAASAVAALAGLR